MIVLGLTGSIGMGKSTTANMFRDAGIAVHDADQTVHDLYRSPEIISEIEEQFPGTTADGSVDRGKLGKAVLGDTEKLKALEDLIHPYVREAEAAFLSAQRDIGADIVVLDIPLLFETGADERVDKILVVTAPEAVQRQRVLSRATMTEEKFQDILARQVPDTEKRKRADFLIDTSLGLDQARAEVERIIAVLTP